MGQNKGTLIAAEINSFNSEDTFPYADTSKLKGGHMQVSTLAERNSIPAERRKELMLVSVIEDGKTYQLKKAADQTLTLWEAYSTGGDNYTHPATHPASMIEEDTTHRFATDSEKNTWNSKASTAEATTSTAGLMTAADKTKLDGVAVGANNYSHPSTHSPSIIVQDANNRFVSDAEKNTWNDKYSKQEVDNKFSTLNTGLEWKASVATYNDIALTYPNPEDGWTVNVKDSDITWRYNGAAWIAISANAIPLATPSVDGKMSAADKTKLDGVAVGANNYTHPANHPASIISQDANNRFVSDAEKNTWNGKAEGNHNHNGTYQPAGSYAAATHSHDYATHRGEGTNFIDYARLVYNNGAYSGSGWVEPSELGVRYAASAGSAPASDVYSWAKQSSKPSYNYSEISGKPSVYVQASQPAGTVAGDIWIKP